MNRRTVPSAQLRGLVTGEVITLPSCDGLAVGDILELIDGGSNGPTIASAYRRWSDLAVEGRWTANVERLIDASVLDPQAFSSRHLLAERPNGTVALLRVNGADGPVLSDAAFAARVRSVDGAIR